MTEEINEQPSELDTLKQRAKLMGIKHHPNIGVDKLRDKVNEQLEEPEEKVKTVAPVNGKPPMKTEFRPAAPPPPTSTESAGSIP